MRRRASLDVLATTFRQEAGMSGNRDSLLGVSFLTGLCGSRAWLAICGSAGIYAVSSAVPQEAKAVNNWGVPYPSFVFRTDCALRGTVADSPRCSSYPGYPRANPPYWAPYAYTTWEWDPPSNDISSISFEFYYNQNLFMPVAGSAGFLCGFSSGGSCPTDPPGTGTVPMSDTVQAYGDIPIVGPSTGTQSIVIGADTVTVNATFSPAVNNGTDTYFFAMDFEPKIDLSHLSIEYSQSLLPNPAYYVMSYSCNGGTISCGSQDYTASFALVPEASTWALMALGFVGLGFAGSRAARRTADVAR
jgi:hypothetical protein